MKLRDRDFWDTCVRNNDDFYGSAVIRYAERWANQMESYLEEGWDLHDIVEKCSKDADMEGISGAQWRFALSTLGRVWAYGNDLELYYENKRKAAGRV